MEIRTDRTLFSKGQVDEITKDYTVKMFCGDINNSWLGSLDSLRYHAEQNAPKELYIGGYKFETMNNHIHRPYVTFDNKYSILMLEYQCDEQIGEEYPVLQIGIRVWRTKGGKVKSEIIRNGYTNRTRFW